MPKIAQHLPLTHDGHHPDDAHQQVIDVIGLILRLAPELLFVILEAVKLYYDQPHVCRIQTSSPHRMLMTLGAIGTTATIQQTTIVALLDPDPLWDHHRLTHHQTHQQTQQHHLEPWPSVYLMVTAKTSDAAEAFSISQFDKNDIELNELVEAANDPHRVRCLTELDPGHTVSLRTTLDQPTKLLFNNFVDEMFNQLAQPYRTMNNELIFIKASQATVTNIAKAFAQARLLDINLARRTRAFYVEPENLLTITVPTGLPKKPIYRSEHAGTYLSYHKTSWESVAKILAEDCIRPATWTRNEAGIPTQYPCYGFFGMSSEIADIDDLPAYSVKLCTSQLYRIGKGQNPSGLLAICRSPKCMRAQSGGNDQIQRLCNLQGIAKGKDGATAMNSSCASVCYVASTHSVFQGLITHNAPAARTSTVTAPSELPDNPPADREPPAPSNPATDLPAPSNPPPADTRSTTTHYETTDHTAPDHDRRYWSNNPSWHDSTHTHRGRHSSYREDRSRDQHREGYSRSRTSAHDYSRSRW